MCRALHDDRGPSGGASHPTGIASVLALLTLLACSDGHRLDVAAPVGDREQDRSAIVAALEHAAPGAVIHLGAGTYVVGGEGIVVGTPAVTMRGHPDGTTLVGCTSDERADMSEEDFWNECNGFALAGEAQRVSGIRFEGFNYALRIEHPRAAGLPERDVPFLGGHVIEDNVFQDVSTFSINLDADSVVQIRNNEFRYISCGRRGRKQYRDRGQRHLRARTRASIKRVSRGGDRDSTGRWSVRGYPRGRKPHRRPY